MAADFNIEARWPELFAGLDERTREIVVDSFASSWHEGWVPNRDDVANLTDLVRGAIDEAEYDRRSAVRRNDQTAVS
ncbi:hypothetical protein ACI3KS_12290 [Microbacterium sp. ZW T5_45]|uniref:antitoxin VbhA family protein n=1 Tax=Microbacterium sp. ZW T5_45 TaxID=3378080 RepID=UPI003851DACC